MSIPRHRNFHVLEFLKSQGIDPDAVLEKSFNHKGYETFRFDSRGHRVFEGVDGTSLTDWHTWRDGEQAAAAVRAWWKDKMKEDD